MRFSPTVWAKLLFWRDRGPCEVGAFGITPSDDLLYIEDLTLLPQQCTWGSVAFDDDAVADYFDRQVDRGLRPEQFARIWLHTHPGNCPQPSAVDEQTFQRVFGGCDWAVMAILAADGSRYARLRFAAGPGGALRIPIEVAYDREFSATDFTAWEAEYQACIRNPLERAKCFTEFSQRSHSSLTLEEELAYEPFAF